jgi:hypothetical protein
MAIILPEPVPGHALTRGDDQHVEKRMTGVERAD